MLDPSLKKHEEELKKVIQELLKAKPDVTIDENFIASLREELGAMSHELRAKKQPKIRSLNGFTKLIYLFSGAAVTALFAIAVITADPLESQPVFESSVKTVDDEAFSHSQAPLGSDVPQEAAKGLGGGAQSTAEDAASSRMIVAPDHEFTQYEYVFEGDLPIVSDDQLAVLKRESASVNDKGLVDTLKRFDFGLIDLSAFSDLSIHNIQMAEEKERGYMFSIDFNNSMITINQNWEYWENPFENCRNEACYERLRLSPSDIPADERLTEIANQFLKKHNINTSDYGTPEIEHRMDEYYVMEAEKRGEQIYVPDTLTVLYPEIVEGKAVYSSPETKAGLRVSVNIRHNAVSNVWGLRMSQFRKSMYETQQDSSAILDWAKEGGWNSFPYGDADKVEELELEAPELVYMTIHNYENKESAELLVPTYLFDVKPKEEVRYYRKKVAVPAVKGFEPKDQPPFPRPLPVEPLIRSTTPSAEPTEEPMIKTEVMELEANEEDVKTEKDERLPDIDRPSEPEQAPENKNDE